LATHVIRICGIKVNIDPGLGRVEEIYRRTLQIISGGRTEIMDLQQIKFLARASALLRLQPIMRYFLSLFIYLALPTRAGSPQQHMAVSVGPFT
jgi:hypothetical protein